MELLRVGVVGCGVISGTHGDALRRLEEEGLARLVGATDAAPGRAEEFVGKYGGKVFGSFEEMIASPDIDSVTLCTPSGLHGPMAAQAARAGKHILSEKPLDVWIDAVDEAIAAAKAAGVTYGGVFQERFSPAARKVKRAVESGAFGEIVLACAETKWYRSQEYYDSGDWRGTWALDAGVFSNQGIHSLDKVQWLAGPVEEVISATLTPGFHRTIEAETLGVATVRFQNGALGTITMTTLAYDGFPERIDVSGTKGSAMLVGDHLAHFTTRDPYEDDFGDLSGGEAPQSNTSKDPAALVGDGHYGNIRDFVLAVREGRSPQVSAEGARHAVNLLNMIYKKARVGPYA
ncbi:oxidoreductase [Capsulimonas corticalis]|uniref:Oxidoreductase n=1 Tax=Capsulimonas corticalis TaxID=2219043 RepID=A0A402CNY9_9BACT|nr:Gfo/Idh/MocA family oxidoreductase [Capsulimonas corticalis]BDI33226.1 oxidoreductase [Capsulimonas corticalis]